MADNAANLRIGAAALSIDGQDVGFLTDEGIVINYEPDVHEHLSGKYGTTPVKASLIGQKVEIEVWIAEHTIDNLGLALAGVTQVGDKIQFGGLAGREITGHEIIITPHDGAPSLYFGNAIPVSSVETNYKVSDERIIHVTFQAYVDSSAVQAENLGYFS